jgi:hypothetical protein
MKKDKSRFLYYAAALLVASLLVAFLLRYGHSLKELETFSSKTQDAQQDDATLWATLIAPRDISEEKTQQYIESFDPSRYEEQGSDYCSPIYSPETLGKPLDQIDRIYDYNFERVDVVEQTLSGVDRKQTLKFIFTTITQAEATDTEKHLAILYFLQASSYHSTWKQPVYPNGTMVDDPLVLLELGEMRCGHVARLAADLFAAAGYETRLVQLGGHVIAEIYYEDDWHYFDADAFSSGSVIVESDGSIPSIVELSQMVYRYALDGLIGGHFEEITFGPQNGGRRYRYPSYHYFAKQAYSSYLPMYYVKTATNEQETNALYGWNSYETISADEIQLYDDLEYWQPKAPFFTNIDVDTEKGLVSIEWVSSEDQDNDLLGYTIFVSRTSRGWNYAKFQENSEELLSYWSAQSLCNWTPDMYENLFNIPPHEVVHIQTDKTSIELPITSGDLYYVTVMPYDAHGESVGKELYYMSNEIMISLEERR